GVEASRPDHHRGRNREAALDVLRHGVGPGEVDGRCTALEPSARRVDDFVAGALERGHEHRADLPVNAEEREPHDASRTYAAFESKAGLIRATASWNRPSSGPMPAAESPAGANNETASSATSSAVTASRRRTTSSIESSGTSVTVAFPSRVIRFDVDSSESSSRPLRFSF